MTSASYGVPLDGAPLRNLGDDQDVISNSLGTKMSWIFNKSIAWIYVCGLIGVAFVAVVKWQTEGSSAAIQFVADAAAVVLAVPIVWIGIQIRHSKRYDLIPHFIGLLCALGVVVVLVSWLK